MKIKFIGVGSAFTTAEYYQSNMLITAQSGKKLLFDCGSDARFSLAECMELNFIKQIEAVYISHLHADHIGGMEWLAFNTYFNPHIERPKLFMEINHMHELWHNALKGGLGYINGKLMHLTDYFECYPVTENGSFVWENINCTLLKMPHVMAGYKNHYSYGLLLQENPPKSFGKNDETPTILITSDTLFQPIQITNFAQKVVTIFHDCETSPSKTSVHAHYDELRTLPPEVKKKIWLYHYQPHSPQRPKMDGFKGFVTKGQEFDFS